MSSPWRTMMTPGDVQSASLAWRVEEACANAYPCWREMRLGGWLLRAAGGHTRRINSVNPLHRAAGDPSNIAVMAAEVYSGLQQPTFFRIPDMTAWADPVLDRLGFVPEGETLTLMAEPAGREQPTGPDDVTVSATPDVGWFAAWHGLRPDVDDAAAATYRRSVRAILVPAAFACRSVDGRPVSVAYAALHDRIAVVESVVTHAAHRGRGHARAVVRALTAWSAAAGAEMICLQVAADNSPALALYRSAGFIRDLYRYRYRRAP